MKTCRLCGCIEETACLHEDGTPCSWVPDQEDVTGPVCSVCVEAYGMSLGQRGKKEPEEEDPEVRRKCRLVGGPRDGELFTELSAEVKSRPHVDDSCVGVYKFWDGYDTDGREMWNWKNHTPEKTDADN